MADIRTLDLNLLKALNALLEERNVTRAARRLGLTQPAVSGMLNRLRDQFEDPLFTRGQRGIHPTPRALELAAPVRRLLDDADALLRPAHFDPAQARMTITIMATDYTRKAVVVPFLLALRTRAPSIHVAVRPLELDGLLELFERGRVDLVLLSPDLAPESLHIRELFEETYVCAMRRGHPLDRETPMDLEEFRAQDHVLMSHSGAVFQGPVDEALANLGRSRRVVASLPGFMAVLELLSRSDLISAVPQRMMAGATEVVARPLPFAVRGFTSAMAWHDRSHRDPAHRWIRTLLYENLDPPPVA